MKIKIILLVFCLCFEACDGDRYSVYKVELPTIPDSWRTILGVPRWRLEWIDENGRKESADLADHAEYEIRILQEWASPIIAYPYWDEKPVHPYTMKPAGAIFPFDAVNGQIALSWIGGVSAVVYTELAKSCADFPKRYPQYFDWQRFRALFEGSNLPDAVKFDPWIVDWKAFCEKTAISGFDRRRIKAMERDTRSVPVAVNSVWIGSSPFAAPLYEENGTLSIPVNENIDIYFSAQSAIKVSRDGSILEVF